MTHTEESLIDLAIELVDAGVVKASMRTHYPTALDEFVNAKDKLILAIREVLAERDFMKHAATDAVRECERLRKEIANLDYRAAYEALEQENVQLRKDVERLRKLLSDLWKCECYGWTEELADSITAAIKDQP